MSRHAAAVAQARKLVTRVSTWVDAKTHDFIKMRPPASGADGDDVLVAGSAQDMVSFDVVPSAHVPQPALVTGAQLRDFQFLGLAFLADRFQRGLGCILADEMGLGKTLQSIAFLTHILKTAPGCADLGPALVVVPLSMLDTWSSELARFAPALTQRRLAGDKAAREQVMAEINTSRRRARSDRAAAAGSPAPLTTAQLSRAGVGDVLLITYENVLQELEFLQRLEFGCLVVDEAHRLKNHESALHRTLLGELKCGPVVLLTGTPSQNNLAELWALLHFVAPQVFAEAKTREPFLAAFAPLKSGPGGAGTSSMEDSSSSAASSPAASASAVPALAAAIRAILSLFMLRRTKASVNLKLPPKHETLVVCGLTPLQRRYYRDVITHNAAALASASPAASCLTNVLASLRKAVNHPYLFPGAEPEPFVEGDHLWQASDKLAFLEALLPVLREKGRRVLVFSTSTATLDILQDYLTYRCVGDLVLPRFCCYDCDSLYWFYPPRLFPHPLLAGATSGSVWTGPCVERSAS